MGNKLLTVSKVCDFHIHVPRDTMCSASCNYVVLVFENVVISVKISLHHINSVVDRK